MHVFPNVVTEGIYQTLSESPGLRTAVLKSIAELEHEGSEDLDFKLGWEIQDRLTAAFDSLESRQMSAEMKRLITLIFAEALRSVDFDAIGQAMGEDAGALEAGTSEYW